MFNLILGYVRNEKVLDFEVEIENCPYHGIEAVDFRRKHGLPELPSKIITLPGRMFNSEFACRLFEMDDSANVSLEHWIQYPFSCNAVGDVYGSGHRKLGHSAPLVVSPKAIKEYLECECVHAAINFLKDVQKAVVRSEQRAKAESKKILAQKQVA